MKINVARSSGFCFGVRRAINISREMAAGRENVCVLGDIVHNDFVVGDFRKRGLKKITRIKPAKRSTLIISAHGAPKKTFEKAEKAGYRIVDATCPKVKDIYRIGREAEKTGRVIIIGDKGHQEVKGIAGQLRKRPVIVESARDVSAKKLSGIKKAAVITQSTQSAGNIKNVMWRLEKIIPSIKLLDTTCTTTRVKQREIASLPKKNDLVLIIGSGTSANTKRLYQISRKINRKTHWINNAKDLRYGWFRNIKSVGIMAGASTPDHVTSEVVAKLKEYSE